MIVLLIGAPGAGKGTQSDLLAGRRGYRKISTGDAFRRHIKNKTRLGKVAESIMAQGKLVPNEVLLEVLKEELGGDPHEKILLDGYPRNVKQAEDLSTVLSTVHKVVAAVHLDVDMDSLKRRLSGRRVCAECGATYHTESFPTKIESVCDKCGGSVLQRNDDKADKVQVRLDVYQNETSPVLEFYKKAGLYHRVAADLPTEDVYGVVDGILLGFG